MRHGVARASDTTPNKRMLRQEILRRQRSQPSPARAVATSANGAGSGVAEAVTSIVRFVLPAPVATIVYTSCSEYGPVPVATEVVAVCVPIEVNEAVSSRVPFGGETALVVLMKVDKVTEVIAPLIKSLVRPLVTLTVPTGEVSPVSVNQRMRVPAPPILMSIVSVSNWPEVNGGVPVAVAETMNESVAPQHIVGGKVTGLDEEAKVVKVGGKVGDSPPLMVIVFALAFERQRIVLAASTAVVSPNFLILFLHHEQGPITRIY